MIVHLSKRQILEAIAFSVVDQADWSAKELIVFRVDVRSTGKDLTATVDIPEGTITAKRLRGGK